MTVKERLKNLLTHPAMGATLILSALGQVGFGLLEPIWGLLSATSGMWFPAIAVTAGTIFPEIGLEDVGTQILIVGAVVYVLIKLDKGIDRAAEYLENR